MRSENSSDLAKDSCISCSRASGSTPLFVVYFDSIDPLCPIKNTRKSCAILPLSSATGSRAGKDALYIGSKGKPEKAKEGNVIRALEHVRERLDHYADSCDEPLPILTPKARS